uniref:LarA-like N-terminal domain-containing protein n=1 Tax=termite gut metagenome TaxID=433724 RepID=S0DFM1_9ZZZZ
MLYFSKGSPEYAFSHEELRAAVYATLDKLGASGRFGARGISGAPRKVLVIPPDGTRSFSRAGEITRYIYDYYGSALTDILPALGTHFAMTPAEIERMFPGVPASLFRVHDWRYDVVTVGTVPAEYVAEVSGGVVNYPWPAQVNRLLVEGGHDLILSVGQVVPHEVLGMANYNKNIFIGTGGAEGINRSHFIGAAYGMERVMGRAINPVRQVLNYASEHFTPHLPIVYMQTVVSKGDDGLQLRGFYAGDDIECFLQASELSLKVNFRMTKRPMHKVVVWLDPEEFRSTWLGNKSIYRTRMAIADGGELIVMAPGLRQFGEDPAIDRLIRKYGYRTTPEVMRFVEENADLRENLSVAAHLIHGTSEGRFRIVYAPGHLSREEIEGVGFEYADLAVTMQKYDPQRLTDGWNTVGGDGAPEEIYYISNPALGLWAYNNV